MTNPKPLTSSEINILQLMAQGYNVKEIADELHLKENTIRSYKKNIYEKLEVNKATSAVLKATKLGHIKF
jgi:DNA-binding NarL/FixJ family response regulator